MSWLGVTTTASATEGSVIDTRLSRSAVLIRIDLLVITRSGAVVSGTGCACTPEGTVFSGCCCCAGVDTLWPPAGGAGCSGADVAAVLLAAGCSGADFAAFLPVAACFGAGVEALLPAG